MNSEFHSVLQAVHAWLQTMSAKYADSMQIQIETDTPQRLLVQIDTGQFIGEIHVSEPECRPYRYVSLMILNIQNAVSDPPAFVFYDQEQDSVQDILRNLDAGIAFLISNK